MRGAEEAAFARGVKVEALMDQAGAGVARAVHQFFSKAGSCAVYVGKGNNGGDALVAAQHLQGAGWKIDLHLAFPEKDCSELTQKKLRSLRSMENGMRETAATLRAHAPSIILDGLLGLGSKPVLREPIRSAAREINRRRAKENAFVFAVDLPTGLDGDSAEIDSEDCVMADFTIAIGYAKHGLVVDSAADFVGRIEVVPLPELRLEELKPNELLATPHSLGAILPRRSFNAYKNQFGRIGVVAGSEGFIGAALLATEGALRAGAGLVELFVPKEIYSIVAAASPAEAMVKPIHSYRDLLKEKVDVWAVGPGLGTAPVEELLPFIEQAQQPMILDADGLNMLSGKIDTLKHLHGRRLLTPHPGEMKRLFDPGKLSRARTAQSFCDQFPVTLLLKGSRTVVCERDRPLTYNSTGNPGMAVGGMGDVLTGVCAALAGRKLPLYDVARIGAWVCGRAAEIAIYDAGASEESLLPRDLLARLGQA
ncbi:MAG: ADP-dependent NAD(P)H-hydrate dehydratase / NAD(P)H-hydrate epimerase, partial [Verrucomicrobiota bacterium]